MLNLPPLLSIISYIRIISRDADSLVLDFFREDKVEEDG